MGNRDQTRHVLEERKEHDVRRRAAGRRRCGEKSNVGVGKSRNTGNQTRNG